MVCGAVCGVLWGEVWCGLRCGVWCLVWCGEMCFELKAVCILGESIHTYVQNDSPRNLIHTL